MIAVARFEPDGSVDSSFGHDSSVLGNRRQLVRRLIVQPDGKLLVFADVESETPKD